MARRYCHDAVTTVAPKAARRPFSAPKNAAKRNEIEERKKTVSKPDQEGLVTSPSWIKRFEKKLSRFVRGSMGWLYLRTRCVLERDSRLSQLSPAPRNSEKTFFVMSKISWISSDDDRSIAAPCSHRHRRQASERARENQ